MTMPNYIDSLPAHIYSNAEEAALQQAYLALDENEYQSQALSAIPRSLLDCSRKGNQLLESSTSASPSFINAYEPLMIEVFEEYGHPYGLKDY